MSDDPQPGALVVVATPIGNLGDLSPRAAEALRTADLVLAEDTRRTGKLLAHVDSEVRQLSLHEHNERERVPELLVRIEAGERLVLVSDAGTPALSDPGYRLIAAAAAAGLRVEAVPGASALLAALVVSGLPSDRVAFEGFLPRKGGSRRDRLAELANEVRTIVLYVSPHRADDDLVDLADALGPDRPAALCRELTKLHEEVVRGSLGDLAARVAEHGIRGELTVVIGGAPEPVARVLTPHQLAARVHELESEGSGRKAAIATVAQAAGVPKRVVFDAVVAAKHADAGR
ncbi:MAG: 16S rRNA (cytidine(1402)-2'-O)-methyltransferase [Nitriliruptor sp.]|uniref:16S rRNA (cytidine(1402)-2'-O)-methyltransferase n=1 Tax=Nitriliruptor sp. TaxID=2448056 RepID=UPI0034A0AC1E